MNKTNRTAPCDLPPDVKSVEAWMGTELAAYLHRKHTGGASGAKGTRYEDVFATIQIAEAAQLKGAGCHAVMLEAQVALSFLDDLKVTQDDSPRYRYFQLKNTGRITWSSGPGSLADDCAQQLKLCHFMGETDIEFVIVTSDRHAMARLRDTMPADLRASVRVQWFPWESSIPRLCAKWGSQLSALAWLSKHATPSFHDLGEVLGILCGAWMRFGTAASAFDIITVARSSSPTLIRPLASDDEAALMLRNDFKAALARVENFSYSVVKGFFSWEVRHPNGSTDTGVLSHDCFSDQFRAFQSRVVKLAPTSFESMEDQLL